MIPGFAEFYVRWAILKGWTVPLFHIRMCHWLESYGHLGLLMVFRGAGKSTMLAVYEAWRLAKNPIWRLLNWSADDNLATKLNRDVRDVLTRHPLTQGMLSGKPAEHQFWVNGSEDERNASVSAYGILSNSVGSRADEIINDDVEVPKNISSQEMREKLRQKLSEATYILVPGGSELYVGTPHTFDSIYTDIAKMGASVLKLPLFMHHQRIKNPSTTIQSDIPVNDLIVMHGKELLEPNIHYLVDGQTITLFAPQGQIDLYSGNLWPERFTREEIANRRKKAFSQNEWDSQYQLQARPIGEIRLDPDKLRLYDIEPIFGTANKTLYADLGRVRLTSVRAYWDVSLGKIKSDTSALCIVFSDDMGNLYWQAAIALTGEIDQQCRQLVDAVKRLKLPNVMIETNGPGGFVPALARKALVGTGCSVTENFVSSSSGSKNRRILDAIEPSLSGRFLWCHKSIAQNGILSQMRDFDPEAKDQPDDYLDALAHCISMTPVRIGKHAFKESGMVFRPQYGEHEVSVSTD